MTVQLSLALQRMLIIGNGGSGKTWLSLQIGHRLDHAPTHLDDVRWEPGRYGVARDKALVNEDVRRICAGDRWLIEGVYGWLAAIALERTTTLVFLDLPEDECIDNLRSRGIQGGESQSSFEELIRWVAGYRYRRNNWNSLEAHRRLFDAFSGARQRLTNRAEIAAYLSGLPGEGEWDMPFAANEKAGFEARL